MLEWIQTTSLALSAISVLMLGMLLLAHAVRGWLASRDTKLAAALSHELILWLDDPEASVAGIERVAHRNPALVTSLVLRLAGQLLGDEHARLIQLASRLGLEARMVRDLRRRRSGIRRRAAESLALFEDDASARALTGALDDRKATVCLAAAWALARRGLHVPLKQVIDKLGGLSDSMLTQELFERLASHQMSDLIALAADDQVLPRLRSVAIRALAASGDYALIPVFTDATRSRQPDVRVAAARALGQLHHPLGASSLAALLQDDVWYVRVAAVEAVGKINIEALDGEIETLLSDASWWVRFRAAEALAMEGERGYRILERTAQGGPSAARDVAALTLLERKEIAT
ncbi:HEAT repeat domain-containing protein [Burkholderia sp. Ac-20353]|uniref:HEAT repeat domain-containing protein n=1 Tax=Burkholderia sp. Ac-20353 TaxID=2703894 RepID=UPI00197C1A13|nr:HEAT repeat domain-containing protein [Burkholderia sp. Ac-20353]MBN3787861.1 HEAT repeat domain-containing protein [Burkholderia sp. Ac-20353]